MARALILALMISGSALASDKDNYSIGGHLAAEIYSMLPTLKDGCRYIEAATEEQVYSDMISIRFELKNPDIRSIQCMKNGEGIPVCEISSEIRQQPCAYRPF